MNISFCSIFKTSIFLILYSIFNFSCIKVSETSKKNQIPNNISTRIYLIAFTESFNYDTTSEISLIKSNGNEYIKLTSYSTQSFFKQYSYCQCYDIRFDRMDSNRITHSIIYGNNPLATSLQTVDLTTKITNSHASILNAVNRDIYSGGYWYLNTNPFQTEQFIFNTSSSIIEYDRSSMKVKTHVTIPSPSNLKLRDLILAPNKSTMYYSLVRMATYGRSDIDTFYLYKTSKDFSNIIQISQWTAKSYYSDNIPVLADVSEDGNLLLYKNGWTITDSLGFTKNLLNQINLHSSPRFIPNNKDSIASIEQFSNTRSYLSFVNIRNNGKRIIYQNLGPGRISNIAIR